MASASFKVDLSGLKRLQAKFDDPALKQQIHNIAQEKAVAALVSQAIDDNFQQEGPGWAPLKAKTIRYGVAKKLRKKLRDMTDKQILKNERLARGKGVLNWLQRGGREVNPMRRILQKTGLLKKTVTTPGAMGSATTGKKKKHTTYGSNIYRVEGTNLVWGTTLAYASVHQHGNAKKGIPARPYLVLREVWKQRIYGYVAQRCLKIIRTAIKAGQ